MSERDYRKLTFNRKLTPVVATFFAVAIVCVRTPAQAVAVPQTLDVASIHFNNTETDSHHHIVSLSTESNFRTVNLALRNLIQFAYGVPDSQILGSNLARLHPVRHRSEVQPLS